MWRLALRAEIVMAMLITFQAARTDVDLTGAGFLGPMTGFLVTWGLLQLIDWPTALAKPYGEVLLGVGALVLMTVMALLSIQPELRQLVFVLYLAVVTFTAALGGKLLQLVATLAIVIVNFSIPWALGDALPLQQALFESVSLVLIASVSGTMAAEFRRETFVGLARLAQIRSRERDLDRLYQVSRTVAAGSSLADVLPELVGRIADYLEAQVGAVLLHNKENSQLVVLSPIWTSGSDLPIAEYALPLRGHSELATVFRSGATMNLRNLDQDGKDHGLLTELGVSNALAVPLSADNKSIGVLVMADKRSGTFTAADAEALENLSGPAGLVLAQLDRYEEVSQTSLRMEELARLKTDFVSVVSHELRTPLTSIIGGLETLARPELSPTEPAAIQLLASARKQANRLRRLIEDLLMVSSLDNDALPQHPERISMAPFVSDLLATVSGAQAVADVDISDGMQLEADPDHLSRVLVNLIENALKYAPGTRIQISAATSMGFAVIVVSDDGEGIPVDKRDEVFEAFSQLQPSQTRVVGGTGLGLSIVKSLVQHMGGEISLGESPSGGASFTIRLPLRAGAAHLASETLSGTARRARLKR